jgi:hypothetical protein
MTFMCLFLVVVILLDYPIIFLPLVNMLLRAYNPGTYGRHAYHLVLAVLVITIDLAVPDPGDVFGLCGSLGISIYCYVLPGLIVLREGKGALSKVISLLAIAVGLVMLFGGTFFIIKPIITGKD